MRKIYWELLGTVIFVVGGTVFAYGRLAGVGNFWKEQQFWSVALIVCWVIVAFGYYHQGWKIHHDHSAAHVSIVLPMAVFVVQCILFVKGIYYRDWSLIAGAVLVNSGVVFSIYQILRAKRR